MRVRMVAALILGALIVSTSTDADAQGWLRKLFKRGKSTPVVAAPAPDPVVVAPIEPIPDPVAPVEDDQRVVITGPVPDLLSRPLLQIANLTRVGGAIFPAHADSTRSAGALAYYNDPTHGPSLYSESEDTFDTKVFQVKLDAAWVDTSDGNLMNRMTLLQNAVDVLEGNMDELTPTTNEFRMWGLLVYNGRLIGTGTHNYDSDGSTRVNAWAHSLTLSSSSFAGWDAIYNDVEARHASGPLMIVPDEAQRTALGGPVLVSNPTGAAIIGKNSAGFAAFAFDPNDIAGRTPNILPAVKLMHFPIATPLQDNVLDICGNVAPTPQPGCDDDPSTLWNRTTNVGGCFIATGYRTMACFGVHGMGEFCYGAATQTLALHGTLTPDKLNRYCYDLRSSAQGDHAYPQRYTYWLWDLNDFVAVKAGTRTAHSVLPYDYGEFSLPITWPEELVPGRLGGVAYDPATKSVYLAQIGRDPTTCCSERPIIWKFTHP